MVLIVLALMSGCVAAGDERGDGVDSRFLEGGKADGGLTAAEIAGVLRVANEASLSELDDDAALDARAAQHIVAYRNGADGAAGTADDQTITTLAELDAIKWVGPVALDKLLAYAYSLGYVDAGGSESDCLIISEYVEGDGNYNKAVELYNCGSAPVALTDYDICLVRNEDTSCSVTDDLGSATLEPGGVTTLCRRSYGHPTSMDPHPRIKEVCQLERPGVMTFSGDDRLMLLRASDGAVMDSLGRFGYQPPPYTWANLVLRRCNFAPHDGVAYYDHRDYFVEDNKYRVENLGIAPVQGCP